MVLSLIKNYIQTLYSHSISYYAPYQKNPIIYTIYSNYVLYTYKTKTYKYLIYFIVKYIRPLFDFFGRWKPFKAIIDWASERATKKIEESEKLQNFAALGLFLFVAIPLPGTGAWVGSLIANFLDLPPKKAIPPIVLGVLTAGIIVLTLTAIANGGIQYLLQRS